MNVTEMVALIEQRLPPEGGLEMIQLSDYELRALIASWRKRGEALKKMQARYEGGQKSMSADALQQALYDAMKP